MAGTPSQSNRGFRYVKNLYGAQAVLETLPVVLSVTYWNGNLVTISGTSGSARVAVAADTSVYGVAAHALGTAVAGDTLKIYPLRGGNVFEAKAHGGLSGGKPENYIGKVADLIIPTATYHRLGTGASTKILMIVGHHPDDKAKATQGLRYWVTGVSVNSIAEEAERH
jgi:hypothetical protein